MTERQWVIESQVTTAPGDAVPVRCVFDRWRPITLEAWERFVIATTEATEDADASPGAVALRMARYNMALRDVFDACVREVWIDGERAEPSDLSDFVRAEVADQVIAARLAEGKARSVSSGETSQ